MGINTLDLASNQSQFLEVFFPKFPKVVVWMVSQRNPCRLIQPFSTEFMIANPTPCSLHLSSLDRRRSSISSWACLIQVVVFLAEQLCPPVVCVAHCWWWPCFVLLMAWRLMLWGEAGVSSPGHKPGQRNKENQLSTLVMDPKEWQRPVWFGTSSVAGVARALLRSATGCLRDSNSRLFLRIYS